MAPVPLSKRPIDALLILPYLLSHIAVTIFIDSQVLLRGIVPYPQACLDLLDWWMVTRNDFLMKETPAWFRSFCFCETFFQFPLFFALSYGIWKAKPWARIWSVIYGAHVATTLVPILFELAVSDRLATDYDRNILMGVYSPYFIVPALMVYRFGFSDPFTAVGGAAKAKKH